MGERCARSVIVAGFVSLGGLDANIFQVKKGGLADPNN
jgi:hypothetical protein